MGAELLGEDVAGAGRSCQQDAGSGCRGSGQGIRQLLRDEPLRHQRRCHAGLLGARRRLGADGRYPHTCRNVATGLAQQLAEPVHAIGAA